jgi:nicotinate-nucleotide pyrophosphorylase (carboxylating)
MNLEEMVLIKDNHRNILEELGIEDWTALIQNVRKDHPSVQIGMEVISAHEMQKAVEAGADFILLDNMAPQQIQEIVKQWKGRVDLEASGGIRLENVELYAAAGVDRISIGSLTHSPRSIDISLEVLGAK